MELAGLDDAFHVLVPERQRVGVEREGHRCRRARSQRHALEALQLFLRPRNTAHDIAQIELHDLIAGAPFGDTAYIVFGRQGDDFGNAPGIVEAADLDGTTGFRLVGLPGEGLGNSVSNAGDVNGDGIDDVVVSPMASGTSYVVFGSSAGFAATSGTLDVGTLDGTNGFAVTGATMPSVSGVGDVNNDTVDDFIEDESQKWADYVQSHIYQPLGMNASSVDQNVSGLAVGYGRRMPDWMISIGA